MNPLVRKYLPLLLRFILGGIFIYAGVLKIGDARAFAGDIAAYKILPYFYNLLVASILPWWEILLGLLLISGYRVKAAAASIGVLNGVFIIAIASAMIRGLDIDCGCFGKESEKIPLYIPLLRDIVFVAMTVAVYRLHPDDTKSSGTPCTPH